MTPQDPVNRYDHFDLLGWCYAQTDGTPVDRHVLLLLSIMSNEHGVCWPKQSLIMSRTGLSERSVRDAIRHWESLGALTTQPRTISRTNGYRVATEYHLNPSRFPHEVLDDTDETPAGDAGTPKGHRQEVQGSPAGGAGPKGITSEQPVSSLRSPRRARREPEEAERGSWLLEDGQETEPGPPEKDWRPKKMTDAQYAVSLARRFARLSVEEGLVGGANVGGLTKFLRDALGNGGDREILSDLIDTFFDGQYFQKGRGTAAPWLQFRNQAYHLHQVLIEREQAKKPRERSATYGAMPQELIERIYGAVPAE